MSQLLSTLTSFLTRHDTSAAPVVLFSCALVASLTLIRPSAANVFDTDDRRELLPRDGFAAVGQITCDGSTRRPVGTLVLHPALPDGRDYDLVVTVAHTFRGRRNAMERRCSFLPGGADTQPHQVIHIALGTLEPGKAWHHDWAVAVIRGTPSRGVGALPLHTISADDLGPLKDTGARYALIGKNGERPRMLISENCGPVPKRHWHHGYFATGEFNHDCDMIPGWSGGPLVLIHKGRRQVVAINTTELNGIVHKVGDPWHPRMFPNTAIRYHGAFRDAVARLAEGSWQRPEIAAGETGAMAFSVLPDTCLADTLETGEASALRSLTADITLVPAAEARAAC